MTYTPTAETPEPVEDSGASVDVARLGEVLLGRWAEIRKAARDLAGRPGAPPDRRPADGRAPRTRVGPAASILVDNGAVHRAFPQRLGGEDNHGGNIAGFQELVIADPSLQIKAGVQWGLFGCRRAAPRHRRNTTTGGCRTS